MNPQRSGLFGTRKDTLIRSGRFSLPGKKALLQPDKRVRSGSGRCDRKSSRGSKKKQRQVFSGKKKYHTLKSQLVVNQKTGAIICIAHGKGRRHDEGLFKSSKVRLATTIKLWRDKGYQGIGKLHAFSQSPTKKPKSSNLSKVRRQENRTLATQRIVIEHVNRKLKIFRILSERYRNRRRRFG